MDKGFNELTLKPFLISAYVKKNLALFAVIFQLSNGSNGLFHHYCSLVPNPSNLSQKSQDI